MNFALLFVVLQLYSCVAVVVANVVVDALLLLFYLY